MKRLLIERIVQLSSICAILLFVTPVFARISWQAQNLPIDNDCFDIAALSPDNLWIAAHCGYALHYDGQSWTVQLKDPLMRFNYTVKAFDPAHVWMLSIDIYVKYFDGTSWEAATYENDRNTLTLRDIDGPDFNDMWAVGPKGLLARWDGNIWRKQSYPDNDWLNAIAYFSTDDIWVCGFQGSLDHYDGQSWHLTTPDANWQLLRMKAFAPDDIWAVGYTTDYNGLLVHYDGLSWQDETPDTYPAFFDVEGLSSDDLWLCGEQGTVLRYLQGAWIDESPVTSKDLCGIAVFEDGHVMVVGDDGLCLEGREFILTPTPTQTTQPTGTPQPTMTPSPTLPSSTPDIFVAGYMNTHLDWQGGSLWLTALLENPTDSVSVRYQGIPTGLALRDDGQGADTTAGDGWANLRLDLPRGLASAQFLLELSVAGDTKWPYLSVGDEISSHRQRSFQPYLEKLGEDRYLPFSIEPLPNDYRRITYAIRNTFKTGDGKDPEFQVLQPASPDPQIDYPLLIYLHGGGFDKESAADPQGTRDQCTAAWGHGHSNSHLRKYVGQLCPEYGYIGVFPENSWADMWLGDGTYQPQHGSRHYGKVYVQTILDLILSRATPRINRDRIGLWGVSSGAVGGPAIAADTPEIDRLILDSGLGDMLATLYAHPTIRIVCTHALGEHQQISPDTYRDLSAGHLVREHSFHKPTFMIANKRERLTSKLMLDEDLTTFSNPMYYDQNLQHGIVYDTDHDGPNLGSHPQSFMSKFVSTLCYTFLSEKRFWLYEAENAPPGGNLIGRVYTNDLGGSYDTDCFSQDRGRVAESTHGAGTLYRSPGLDYLIPQHDYRVQCWLTNPNLNLSTLGEVKVVTQGGVTLDSEPIRGSDIILLGEQLDLIPAPVACEFTMPAGEDVYVEVTVNGNTTLLCDVCSVIEK